MVVMQPQTGYILAMVGGRSYGESQFNRITQSRRQPGSAFKPFVFLSGLDQFTPASILSNAPISYERDGRLWKPENYEPMTEETVSLRQALAKSVNRATVDLSMQVGLDRIIETALRFGFSTPFHPFPSLSLGASEVIPLELARAYCAFASDGVLPFPLSLKAVFDEKGEILERRHMNIERVTSPEKAYMMNSMLRSVITDGTGRSLTGMGISFPVCGKTGTTNDFRDAWFVGYTPDILALVWVGFDNGDPVQTSGSAAALPIWAEFMKSVPQQNSGGWFTMPPGIVRLNVCPKSGQIATQRCPETVEEIFLSDLVPREICALHRMSNPFEQILRGVKDLFKRD
jgi:penicillin-binding protein 1B